MPALASSTATRRSISASTLVEPLVARAVLEVGGHGFEPQQRALVERTGQQPELELVERIERPAAVLDRAAAPFDRILDSLQRDQRVDAAQRAQRDRGALRLRPLALGQREGAAGAAGAPPAPQ